MRENSYRLGFSQIKPYRYYYGVLSPFKGLEVDLRITEVLDVPSGLRGQRNFKDKAIDLKYQFIPEGKYIPAISLGLMDPHGTRVYPSQYIVASKQIYPFDFTLGFGNGRFGKGPLSGSAEGLKIEMITDPEKWFNDSQFFWGIQFALSKKIALMLEYSPIKYHEQTKDPAQRTFFQNPVHSKYNFGIRLKPTKWSEVGISYQRGNQIGIHVSTAFGIGKPLIPIHDPLYREMPADSLNPLSERITRALYRSGFSDIRVLTEGDGLWIEAQNEKYFYTTRAIGVITRILADITPEHITTIHIILKENGIPKIEFTSLKADIIDFYREKLSVNEFLYLSTLNTDITDTLNISSVHKKSLRYGLKPSFETFLNDPSGFFKYRLGISGWMSYTPWKGATVATGIEGYPVNNISTTNEPLSIPVRSDIVLYKREHVALGRLLFDQIYKTENDLYGKVSAGFLEIQYAGIDAEIAKPFFDGRILLGIGGSAVRKRDPDDPFAFKENPVKDIFTTAFVNTRINIHEKDIALDVKAGRFLAGDEGVRFTVSKFINGVVLSAWYTITDTSDFTDPFNKGYNDKGISVSIPIRLFAGTDSRVVYNYSLTPWTRDTGQDIDHFGTLFDFIGRDTNIFLDKDKEMMY
jgi:hypothetical protein